MNEVQANPAHVALAQFEKEFPGNFTLVTQNVDNLHESADSKNILHMHGELLKARCVLCENIHHWTESLSPQTRSPCCQKSGSLRPNIVWFGEMPLFMEEIEHALKACDLFVSIGTSGQVYPAAGFVQLAQHCGATTVELNLEPCGPYSTFMHAHYGPATREVAKFFAARN